LRIKSAYFLFSFFICLLSVIDTGLKSDFHFLNLLYWIDQKNLFISKYLTLAGGILFQKFFS
jgi:hypothetical protein